MTGNHTRKTENNNLLVRNASSEELDEVTQLLRDSYLEYKNSFPPEGWKSYLDNIVDARSAFGRCALPVGIY